MKARFRRVRAPLVLVVTMYFTVAAKEVRR